MEQERTIDVVLAACNGERYIAEQIASVQRCRGYRRRVRRFIVADDASDDATCRLVRRLAAADDKIILLEYRCRVGCVANFSRAVAVSTAPYVMLCDQDDVWLEDKIELAVARLAQMERCHGRLKPLLVFADMQVVDAALRPLQQSFWRCQKLSPQWSDCFARLLVQNVAAGCTMLVNRPLLDLALPFPTAAVMHDWWLMLVARAFGSVGWNAGQVSLYRQHGGNQVGVVADSRTPAALMTRLSNARRNLYRLSAQAREFARRYRGCRSLLSSADTDALSAMSQLPLMPLRCRWRAVVSGTIRKNTLGRNMGLLLIMLLPPTGVDRDGDERK